VSVGVPLDVADVEASAAVEAGSSAHQLLEKDVVAKSNVEDSVDGEALEVFIELSLSPWEAVEDDSFGRLGLLHLFVDDLDHDLVLNKTARLDDALDRLDEGLVEASADGTFQDFSDFVSSRNVVVAEILSEKFGVGALADTWSPEEEDELLAAAAEAVDKAVGESEHFFNKIQSIS
jgi:hypothetical protein